MCSFRVLAEPAPPSRCELFWCEKYRLFLTHAGCLERQTARIVNYGLYERPSTSADDESRSRPRHRFCAKSCEQGRAIGKWFEAAEGGDPR